VVINHSGGKDSQAMYNFVKNLVPDHRLVVIHASLGHIEWPGTIEHIENTTYHEFYTVKAKKTFFDMVRHRGFWPSPSCRQCTSDLKRGPISKKIRQLCNERGFNLVLNCTGIRAEESTARSKKDPFKLNKRQTNSKRTWYEWMPIHDWTTEAVFDYIASFAQDVHWAYYKGMSRLSCSFCIMSSQSDLKIAARLRPELLEEYSSLEHEINQTFLMPTKKHGKRFLKQIDKKPTK
jgi:DNA sulfur modification protein DndC